MNLVRVVREMEPRQYVHNRLTDSHILRFDSPRARNFVENSIFAPGVIERIVGRV